MVDIKTLNGHAIVDEVAREKAAAPDWHQMQNKPTEMVGGDTLVWDGDTKGLVAVENAWYKVSDAAPTKEDFANGASWVLDGETTMLDGATIQSLFDENGGANVNVFVVVPYDGWALDGEVIFPDKGLYIMLMGGSHLSSLTIPGYTGFAQEIIKQEVLPEALRFGDVVNEVIPETAITGVEDNGAYVATIDVSLFSGDEEALIVTFDGVEYNCAVDNTFGLALFGNLSLVDGEDTGEPFCIFPSQAICFVRDTESHTLQIKAVKLQKIDDKYIDTQTVFYFGITEKTYLYSYQILSSKVTIEQLLKAYATKPISIRCVMDDARAVIAYCTPVICSIPGEYAAVVVSVGTTDSSMNLITLRTAEYTPETT